jgi:two-component system LytT family response regulator
MRCLIVDDEALARGRIRKLLAPESDVEVVGECADGPQAIKAIREQKLDLVFLDVQMPEVSGFDVLRAVPEQVWPAIIFVTAHDQHAIQAFEVHALDYLLKPFSQARLQEAVRRAREHLQARETANLNRQLAQWLKTSRPEPAHISRIPVKTGNQTLFIRIEDIDYIESASNYAVVRAQGENHVLRETLTNLEGKLPERSFLRISRSIIVNLERVKGIQSAPRGEYLVLLHEGRQLLLTRGLQEIQEKLQYPAQALSVKLQDD